MKAHPFEFTKIRGRCPFRLKFFAQGILVNFTRWRSSCFYFEHRAPPVKSWSVFQLVLISVCLPTSQHHRKLRAVSNESSLCFLSKSLCSSSISPALPLRLLYLSRQFLSSASPATPSPLPPHPAPPSSSLYTVHHLKRWGCWALGGIKVIYEWANLPGCWRGKPVAVRLSDPAAHCSLQPHCRGSSSASPASDLLPFLTGAACYR